MGELERLNLIEQNKSKSILSLRPVVRDGFRFLTSEADKQRFFDNAAYLLLFHPAPSQTLTTGSFLIESGSYQEVEHIIEVAKTAFETLGEENQDQELYSDLCALSELAYAHRGLFTAARPWLEQAHQMRAGSGPSTNVN
ncbi:hypothetical protein CRV24_008786 [Beauveria bassiana]|nr:hypothetical protein CRV24_008786 [Beauveria bassiana]KAH8715241.1 hypothetical protein HC256_004088 [Beauveria bassiana]